MKDWPWYGPLILIAIIAALLYFVYFKPKNDELKNLKAERIQVEDDVRRLRREKKKLDKIEAELVVLNKTLKELEAIIPERKEIWDILKKMHQLALNSRLDIDDFTPRGEVKKEFYYEWPIPMKITGSYHNLALFFDRLSNFSRLFNIEGFSLKALGKQTEGSTITANFTAKTYIFREEVPAEKEKKGAKKGR